MIPDFGFPKANVAPCLIALEFYGDVAARDAKACRLLFETYWCCEQDWARDLLSRGICPHVDRFLREPWGILLLEVALLTSPSEELCHALQAAMQRLAATSFMDICPSLAYRIGVLCLHLCKASRSSMVTLGLGMTLTQLAKRLNGISQSLAAAVASKPPHHSLATDAP